MKKNFELINKNYDRVIIKDNGHNGQLLELSADINRETVKIEKINYRLMMYEDDNLARWVGEDKVTYYISEESLVAAQKLIKKNIRELKVKLASVLNNPAYKAMQPYADEIIKHFKTDFTFHDAIQLANHDINDHFIWIVRTCGTHLFFGSSAWSEAVINQTKHNSENYLCFVWDGGELKNVSIDDARLELESFKYEFLK